MLNVYRVGFVFASSEQLSVTTVAALDGESAVMLARQVIARRCPNTEFRLGELTYVAQLEAIQEHVDDLSASVRELSTREGDHG